jgi:hypothetical protein
MKKEEVFKYNKKCAKFLGFKCSINEQYELPKMMAFPPKNNSNLCHIAKICCIEDMQFHSDWNWIMEVIEAIESLKLGNVKIPATWSSMHQGVRHDIEEYYDAIVVFDIKHSDCIVDVVGTMRLRNDFIVVDNLPTKKEAVVQAIDQFLTWYNKNKSL